MRNKRAAVEKFRRHLGAADLADRTLYWSGVTDPYAAPPRMTRGIWEALLESPQPLRPRRIAVQTRFRADRDAALIGRYASATRPVDGGPPVVVSFTLGTDRDDLIRAWEAATPGFEERMAAISTLRAVGICVVPTLSPFALWRDLRGSLLRLRDLGAAYVTVLFFKHSSAGANTPPGFLAHLRRDYSELLDPAWQADRLAETEAVFGAGRVLTGKQGFASLIAPHTVIGGSQSS